MAAAHNLGRLLFFDSAVALRGDNSCAGCHSPTNIDPLFAVRHHLNARWSARYYNALLVGVAPDLLWRSGPAEQRGVGQRRTG